MLIGTWFRIFRWDRRRRRNQAEEFLSKDWNRAGCITPNIFQAREPQPGLRQPFGRKNQGGKGERENGALLLPQGMEGK